MEITMKNLGDQFPVEVVGVNDVVSAVKITDGPYIGVVYTYSDIKFQVHSETGEIVEVSDEQEIREDQELHLAFEYIAFENLNEVELDNNFKQFAGDILVAMITAAADDIKDSPNAN